MINNSINLPIITGIVFWTEISLLLTNVWSIKQGIHVMRLLNMRIIFCMLLCSSPYVAFNNTCLLYSPKNFCSNNHAFCCILPLKICHLGCYYRQYSMTFKYWVGLGPALLFKLDCWINFEWRLHVSSYSSVCSLANNRHY